MKLIQLIMVSVLLVSSNAFATEVFKCVQSDGKNVFSDKPCPKGIEEEKVSYSDQSWQKALESNKPEGITILNLKPSGEDTVITYQFFNYDDSHKFIKLANELSKQNINLLKIKLPINGEKGEAVIQVTKKESKIFKDMDKE